jgi:hypothetical protein
MKQADLSKTCLKFYLVHSRKAKERNINKNNKEESKKRNDDKGEKYLC